MISSSDAKRMTEDNIAAREVRQEEAAQAQIAIVDKLIQAAIQAERFEAEFNQFLLPGTRRALVRAGYDLFDQGSRNHVVTRISWEK